jgi:hypothetical protein
LRVLLPPAGRSMWMDSSSAELSMAGSLRSGFTGTLWACSGRLARCHPPVRDGKLAVHVPR